MKLMKILIPVLGLSILTFACNSPMTGQAAASDPDTHGPEGGSSNK